MGRRPKTDKRLPSEYPQMAFRVSKEKKEELSTLIENIQSALNRKRKKGDPFINKNDVFIDALEKGLRSLRK
jgi:hypothetical protein